MYTRSMGVPRSKPKYVETGVSRTGPSPAAAAPSPLTVPSALCFLLVVPGAWGEASEVPAPAGPLTCARRC